MSAESPPLPVEVWSHILKQIPKPNQPRLLGVCSLFRDVLLSTLFGSIKIYFIGAMRGTIMLNTVNEEWIGEIAGTLMTKSWELLNHICQEPRFARFVKEITVIAFGDGLALFEQMTVANALLFVPNLQAFRWIGCGPVFGPTVAECLPSSLRKLVVQSTLPLGSLQHLNSLEHLHLSTPWFFPDDEEIHDGWIRDDELMELCFRQPTIERIFENFTSHLQSLRITASQVRGIPIRILNTLLELEIIWIIGDEDESVGLDLVFHHANLLRSLTMVGYLVPGLFASLPSFPSLPHLTSFRISCEPTSSSYLEEGQVDLLCRFLQNRLILRRLYLRLPLTTLSETYDIWCAVENLLALEVLGLHAGSVDLEEHDFWLSLSKLPPKLRALHLAFHCETSSLLLLVDAVAKLQNLTFLHLYGVVSRLPILLEDLATDAKNLQMIGLNRALWDIERVGTTIVTNKWPRWKIKFCTEHDFLCGDDAWLFQYN